MKSKEIAILISTLTESELTLLSAFAEEEGISQEEFSANAIKSYLNLKVNRPFLRSDQPILNLSKIWIKEGNSTFIWLQVNQIVLIQSAGHYSKVHTIDGRILITKIGIRNFVKEKLEPIYSVEMLQIGRSNIVNINHMSAMSKSKLKLVNNIEIPLSNNARKTILKKLQLR